MKPVLCAFYAPAHAFYTSLARPRVGLAKLRASYEAKVALRSQ